jgi:replicative DNA helicase
VDVITVSEDLKKTGELETAGGLEYLAELVDAVPTAANIEYHARIVRDKALMRRLIDASSQIIRDVYEPGEREVEEILDLAEAKIFQVAQSHDREGFVWIKEILWPTFEHIERLQQSSTGITGVPTGFADLDRMTTGLQRGDLVIVAARPSMGKTSWVMNVAQTAAIEHNVTAAIFSLEMSKEQLVQRLLCSEGRVDAQKLRRGKLSSDEYTRLATAAGHLNTAPLWIDDSPGTTVLQMRAKARRLKSETKLGLVVVDYMQLMSGSGKAENRVQEVSQISRGLKALARELDVPVIALSQLSRAPEQRTDRRPQLSDLRESGCLAGDSLVPLATGGRATMAQLEGSSGFQVWALDESTKRLVAATVSRAFCTGIKPVWRLNTALGRSIRATANHRFLTIGGWKRLDELTEGQHLALPRFVPASAEGKLSGEEVSLLGHLIGDGCTLERHVIQYTTWEPDLAEEVAGLASAVFGADVSPRITPERRWFQVYLTSSRHHTHGVHSAVRDWLHGLGVWDLRSFEKRVPEALFYEPVDSIGRFLRHLWSTDGSVHMRGGAGGQPGVYYATSSERLARDVQDLLLRLHITAILHRVPQHRGRDQYHVVVSGRDDLDRFIETVGAVGARRVRTLEEVARFLETRGRVTNRDVVPAEVWATEVRPAMAGAGLTHRALAANMGMQYCGSALFKSNLSRQRAARVAAVTGSRELDTLAHSHVYWDRITGIEPAGDERVYDLTVPGPHNFIANGIVAHNSLEQDADVVMFLYRPEYYFGPTDSNGNSIEGEAELIVAKQRNGPTGMVPLHFHKEYTRFESRARGEDEDRAPPPRAHSSGSNRR